MHNLQRKLLSQNFLYNRSLVSKLIGGSSIGKDDLVIEIGPGKGIITNQLIKRARKIIAVELDPYWFAHLSKTLVAIPNLELHQGDFLQFPLSPEPYKVFANLPFAIEGKIIRKLIDDLYPPQDCYLVVMQELAERLCAVHRENLFSLTHKPWFDFSVIHHFNPNDFRPIPNVNPVLFRFQQKSVPLLPMSEKRNYVKFVTQAFGNGQPLRATLTRWFPAARVDKVLQRLSISKKTRPTHLQLSQWIALYRKLMLSTMKVMDSPHSPLV